MTDLFDTIHEQARFRAANEARTLEAIERSTRPVPPTPDLSALNRKHWNWTIFCLALIPWGFLVGWVLRHGLGA